MKETSFMKILFTIEVPCVWRKLDASKRKKDFYDFFFTPVHALWPTTVQVEPEMSDQLSLLGLLAKIKV